jgi:hypothetical protein
MGLNIVRRSSVEFVLACAPFLCSCSFLHDGRKAFQASQKEAPLTKHFNVELDEPAKMAHVKRSQVVDCDAQYFYEHEVLDRTAEGIETGGSLSQGRPSSHQERDTLFVGGKTYAKNTSSWENASSDDASPDWHTASLSRDPSDECRAMAVGRSLGYVSYDTILEEGHIEYLGSERVNGHRCLEYDVKFASQVLKEIRVCLGSSDHLPYQVMREDYTATYSYEPVTRLPVPEQAAKPRMP